MKKTDITSFWFGLLSAAVFSFLLYRLLRPRTSITPKPLIVKRPAASPVKERPEPEVKKDSLVKIRGIGPVTEKSLNDAGIFSFAQLARTSAADLEPYTGSRWDPNDWIEQAGDLSETAK